ncbi:MAG: prepilin-type N-terminal cleavage/methylation domain-containing protein [Pseudomonadales bacterium]|nr:prepilin-type N-terminal cleavage/methylation domain-containing protein [Pseudomonadales bacterium]
MTNNISRNTGFTLIEVLIASAIVMGSIGLLLSLFGSSLDRMQRVGEQAHIIIAEKEIINRLSVINPAKQQKGEGKFGDWAYQWSAHPITSFKHVSDYLGEIPYPRYLALFAIDIEIIRPERKTINLRIHRLGWRETP